MRVGTLEKRGPPARVSHVACSARCFCPGCMRNAQRTTCASGRPARGRKQTPPGRRQTSPRHDNAFAAASSTASACTRRANCGLVGPLPARDDAKLTRHPLDCPPPTWCHRPVPARTQRTCSAERQWSHPPSVANERRQKGKVSSKPLGWIVLHRNQMRAPTRCVTAMNCLSSRSYRAAKRRMCVVILNSVRCGCVACHAPDPRRLSSLVTGLTVAATPMRAMR